MEISKILSQSNKLSKSESAIIEAHSKTQLRFFLKEQKVDLASKVWLYVKAKLSLRSENDAEDATNIMLITEDLNQFDSLTDAEIMLGLQMGLNGQFLSNRETNVFWNSSNFVLWIKKFVEYRSLKFAEISKQIKVEEAKPIPDESELKQQAIKSANDYADIICRYQEAGKEYIFPYGGLSHLYDYLDKFQIIRISIEQKQKYYQKSVRENPKLPHEVVVTFAKAEAYKDFIYSMVEMDLRLNQNGELE